MATWDIGHNITALGRRCTPRATHRHIVVACPVVSEESRSTVLDLTEPIRSTPQEAREAFLVVMYGDELGRRIADRLREESQPSTTP